MLSFRQEYETVRDRPEHQRECARVRLQPFYHAECMTDNYKRKTGNFSMNLKLREVCKINLKPFHNLVSKKNLVCKN